MILTKENACFNIFHIPNLGDDHSKRFSCYINLKEMLSQQYNNLNSPAIRIQNEEDYNLFKEKYYPLNINGNLTHGEIGLWASNLIAFDNFLKSEYDYLILFEDDAELNFRFFDVFDKHTAALPDNFDLFALFVRGEEHVRFTDVDNNNEVVPLYQWWDTGGVLYSRSGVEKILRAVGSNGIDCPIDLFFYDCNLGSDKDNYGPAEPKASDNSRVIKKYNFISYGLHPKADWLMGKLPLKSNIWELPRINFSEKE